MRVLIQEEEWRDRPSQLTPFESGHLLNVRNGVEQKMLVYAESGIPQDWRERLESFQDALLSRSETLVCGPMNTSKKEVAHYWAMLDGLTTVLAIMSSFPYGVEMFGVRYQLVSADGEA